MTALRGEAVCAILMFIECEAQSKTQCPKSRVFFFTERRAEADSNRRPSAYQRSAPDRCGPGRQGVRGRVVGRCRGVAVTRQRSRIIIIVTEVRARQRQSQNGTATYR